MKKLLIAIPCILFLFGNAFATTADTERRQEATPAAQSSEQDAAALQKSAKELAKMFGVEQPKKVDAAAAPTSEKTVAAVMDKAIDKVSDVVGAMANAINNIAPEVWRIMVKQQYAKAVGYIVVPFLAVLVFVGGFFAVKVRYAYIIATRNDKENPEEVTSSEIEFFWALKLVASILIGFCSLWLANRIADAALFLINPEFYAIQDLLRMILNKGM